MEDYEVDKDAYDFNNNEDETVDNTYDEHDEYIDVIRMRETLDCEINNIWNNVFMKYFDSSDGMLLRKVKYEQFYNFMYNNLEVCKTVRNKIDVYNSKYN